MIYVLVYETVNMLSLAKDSPELSEGRKKKIIPERRMTRAFGQVTDARSRAWGLGVKQSLWMSGRKCSPPLNPFWHGSTSLLRYLAVWRRGKLLFLGWWLRNDPWFIKANSEVSQNCSVCYWQIWRVSQRRQEEYLWNTPPINKPT